MRQKNFLLRGKEGVDTLVRRGAIVRADQKIKITAASLRKKYFAREALEVFGNRPDGRRGVSRNEILRNDFDSALDVRTQVGSAPYLGGGQNS